jgi:MFS family permease
VDLAGSRRSHPFTPAVVLLMASQFLWGVLTAPVGTFFPVYFKDLGYSAVLLSQIVTLQRVTCLLATVAGGSLSDTVGPKRTLVAGQAALVAGLFIFLATGAGSITLIWAVYGIGMGLLSIGSLTYLMEKSQESSLGLLTALYYWGSTLGGAAGNAAAGVLLSGIGFPGLTPFMVAPAIVTIILTAFVLPRSRRAMALTSPLPRRTFGILFGYGVAARSPVIRLLGLLRFLPTFCYGLLIVFVPLQLQAAGASHGIIALYAAVSSVCASAAQLLAGRFADRVSWKVPTVVSFALLALSSLGIALLADSLWSVFTCASFAIIAAWSLSTLLPTLVARVSAPAEHGRVLGFVQLSWNLAMILSGLVGGILFEAWKGLPFVAGAAASGCALIVAAAFSRRQAADT